ncbi:Low-density lipoprotein receptor-related protein 2, partial [Armadillidium nasatum]
RKENEINTLSDADLIRNKNARQIIQFSHNKNILKYFMPNKNTERENTEINGRSARLGRSCFHEEDCGIGTGHVCVNNSCQCHPRFVNYNDTHCLAASFLGESCRSHSQCSIKTEGSFCKWIVKKVLGKCRCKHGMPRMGNKCGSPGFALGAPCGKSYDCSQHVPGAICVSLEEAIERKFKGPLNLSSSRSSKRDFVVKDVVKKFLTVENTIDSLGGICKCPQGHLAIRNGTACVPLKKDLGVLPVSLGKPCYYSDQCKASDPFSFCNNGCFSDGRCVSPDFVCDGKHDCRDASDERICSKGNCSTLSFMCEDGTCISRAQICDGRYDCPDKSDELRCKHRDGGCPSRTFRCKDGDCLPSYEFCNALPSCRDKSDEDIKSCVGGMLRVPHCPYRCNNGRCRSLSVLCSGSDGCGDNSDEENCSICRKGKRPRGNQLKWRRISLSDSKRKTTSCPD